MTNTPAWTQEAAQWRERRLYISSRMQWKIRTRRRWEDCRGRPMQNGRCRRSRLLRGCGWCPFRWTWWKSGIAPLIKNSVKTMITNGFIMHLIYKIISNQLLITPDKYQARGRGQMLPPPFSFPYFKIIGARLWFIGSSHESSICSI